MNVSLVSVTPEAEKLILYIARVSSNNQTSEKTGLIKYLIKHKHWSPFEHAHMTVEIVTSRAIGAQLLRHRSFSFQEFSQRYAEVQAFEPVEIRRQAEKNRQSSAEVFDPVIGGLHASTLIQSLVNDCNTIYKYLVDNGVAREVARMVLPLATQTKIYMTGNLRSWVHYLELRTQEDTQKEHRDIALAIKQLFVQQFPIISTALEWNEDSLTQTPEYSTLVQRDSN